MPTPDGMRALDAEVTAADDADETREPRTAETDPTDTDTDMPDLSGGTWDSSTQPRGGRVSAHAERHAEMMVLLQRMGELPAEDPERERLRQEVIEGYMPYARYVAHRYGQRGEPTDDLIQVAYLGLVKSVDNFDPQYGTTFLTYATPIIIGEIKRYFRDTTWAVHVPRRMQELTANLRKATESLTHSLGRSPTVEELAVHLNAEPEEIVEAFDAAGAYTAASLDTPVDSGGEDGAALIELLGDDDGAIDHVINRESLKPLLAKLSERDKQILLMRYFRNMTQAQIGAELGVSQMQVSRLLSRILGQLRTGLNA